MSKLLSTWITGVGVGCDSAVTRKVSICLNLFYCADEAVGFDDLVTCALLEEIDRVKGIFSPVKFMRRFVIQEDKCKVNNVGGVGEITH